MPSFLGRLQSSRFGRETAASPHETGSRQDGRYFFLKLTSHARCSQALSPRASCKNFLTVALPLSCRVFEILQLCQLSISSVHSLRSLYHKTARHHNHKDRIVRKNLECWNRSREHNTMVPFCSSSWNHPSSSSSSSPPPEGSGPGRGRGQGHLRLAPRTTTTPRRPCPPLSSIRSLTIVRDENVFVSVYKR